MNIIEDDDDDDDDHSNEVTVSKEGEEEMPKSVEKQTDQPTISYGVEQGFKVQAVLGINRTKGDQLHYLVHYQSPTPIDDNMELIPADVAKKFCEDEIIQFYETRITWNVSTNAD